MAGDPELRAALKEHFGPTVRYGFYVVCLILFTLLHFAATLVLDTGFGNLFGCQPSPGIAVFTHMIFLPLACFLIPALLRLFVFQPGSMIHMQLIKVFLLAMLVFDLLILFNASPFIKHPAC